MLQCATIQSLLAFTKLCCGRKLFLSRCNSDFLAFYTVHAPSAWDAGNHEQMKEAVCYNGRHGKGKIGQGQNGNKAPTSYRLMSSATCGRRIPRRGDASLPAATAAGTELTALAPAPVCGTMDLKAVDGASRSVLLTPFSCDLDRAGWQVLSRANMFAGRWRICNHDCTSSIVRNNVRCGCKPVISSVDSGRAGRQCYMLIGRALSDTVWQQAVRNM